MKKIFKIIGITLHSIIGLVLIVAGIAVWIVFTPERLTPIARDQAAKYINCQHEIGEVNLAFIRTFPNFGAHISHVLIINPVEGAQSDTLLYMEELLVKIDAKALWKRNEIIINDLWAKGVSANLFFGNDSITNFDIFNIAATEEPEVEESSSELPFGLINMDKAAFYEINLTYVDQPMGMKAGIHAFNGEVGANYKEGKTEAKMGLDSEEITAYMELDSASAMEAKIKNLEANIELKYSGDIADIVLSLKTPEAWVSMDGENYLSGAKLEIDLPVVADLNKMSFDINQAKMVLEKIGMQLNGNVTMAENDDIITDIEFGIDKLWINEVLPLVPPSMLSMLEGIEVDGIVGLGGTVVGVYNDSLMPVVTANISVEETKFRYSELPYTFTDISGNVIALVDMNNESVSNAKINNLFMRTGESTISAAGSVNEMLSDNMKFDFSGNVDLLLQEFGYFMPEGITASGRAKGPVKLRLSMAQLDRMDLEAMRISGLLDVTDLVADMDTTMHVNSGKLKLNFSIPSSNPEASLIRLNVTECEGLDIKMYEDMKAALKGVEFTADISNVMVDTTKMIADVDLKIGTADASMEDISGTLEGIVGDVLVNMDMIDSIAWPRVEGNFVLEALHGAMDTITVNITKPTIGFTLDGTPEDRGQMMASIDYQSASLSAAAGDYLINTESLRFAGEIKQDSLNENILLQWNPVVSLNLNGGNVSVPELEDHVMIPMVIFDFNSERAVITEGRFNIGQSDFRLTGAINNIANYLSNKGLLQGELDFTSELTDVNYFMDLTSGVGVEFDSTAVEEEEEVLAENGEDADPFMVPMGVDIVLNTNIKQALVGKQIANNLGGKLYIKDGVLVLEEMGFVSDATKLQLTAIYKSPRKNHLYVGLDYHMIDIEIDKLLEMIPDIDTIMPMLKAFHGNGEFHLAAETYLFGNYDPKMSTIRGAASIKGEDLVVMDSTVFKKIKRLTLMGRNTENRIDSINAEITVFRDEVDVYPLMVSMGRYQAILGGRHNLDMTYDYHLSLTESPLPFRLGVNVFTKPKGLKIRLARCKYAADYRPEKRYVVDAKQRELRAIIRDALTANVREEEPEEE